MKLEKLHQEKVAYLQRRVADAFLRNKKISFFSQEATPSLGKGVDQPWIDPFPLNKILKLDVEKNEIWVEPGVTMKRLVDATYKKGLIPKVLPEFKGITVGAAVGGRAAESSSFKYGLFHDICSSFEILLGNGNVLWVNGNVYRDLFHGAQNSFGSLALLLSVKITLEPHPKRVHLDLYRFSELTRMTRALKTLVPLSSHNFIEGIGFHSNEWVLIVGKYTDEKGRYSVNLSKSSPPFYEQIHHLANQKIDEVEMDFKAYLFRHDDGAFWMSNQLSCWNFFSQYLFQKNLQKNRFVRLIEELRRRARNPSMTFFKQFFTPRFSSENLYKMLHRFPIDWVKEHFMIQDCYIPLKNLDHFLNWIETKIDLFPLWLCPIRSIDSKGGEECARESHFFINVGLYGIPKADENGEKLGKLLEEKVRKVGGKKMLYGHNAYFPNPFWKTYSFTTYESLRKKYGAEDLFPTISPRISG